MKPSTIGRFELASLVALDAEIGAWFVVGTREPNEPFLLQADLEGILGRPVPVLPVSGRDDLVREAQAHANEVVVLDCVAPIRSLELDALRSALERSAPAVLVFPTPALSELIDVAPHFSNWAAGRFMCIEDDRTLDQETREQRIVSLRTRYGLDDQRFVAAVERGAIAMDADVAEWLVLLDRGDLVEPTR